MPRYKSDEDLFKNSTMTFGEHLEELRGCLFKALLGLVIGFLVGLLMGKPVVRLIQTPLQKALDAYYMNLSQERIKEQLAERGQSGQALPEDAEQITDLMTREKLVSEEVYIDLIGLLQQLKQSDAYRSRLQDLQLPPPDPKKKLAKDDLVPIFLWHRIVDDTRVQATSLSAHEPFIIWIKASLLVGALLSSPWIFYQIWAFVAAGLYGHERRYVHVFLPFSLGLFMAGAATAFFFVFEPVLTFLLSFNKWLGIDPDPRISEWLSFVLVLPLGFGISFQLPLVMLFLERIGVFDVAAYLSKWRVAILVIFVLAMFLTPADPTSMLLMAMPLTVLYFGGILLCHLMPRRQSPFDEPEE